jgi:hypothetical protein
VDRRTKKIYVQGMVGGQAAALADFSSVAQQLKALSESTRVIGNVLASHQTTLTTAVESMVRAHSYIAEIARAFDPIRELLQEISRSQRLWAQGLSGEVLAQIQGTACLDLSNLLSFSRHLQEQYASLAKFNLTPTFQVEKVVGDAITSSLLNFSHAYEQWWHSIQAEPARFLELPRVLVKYPPLEMYVGAKAAATVSEEIVFEPEDSTESEVKEISNGIEKALGAVSPILPPMYRGALEALRSGSVDRARHFAVSLRELLTQVLGILAPEPSVKGWSSNPENFDDHNRPTRRARLRFLCKGVSQGEFGNFLEADHSAVLTFIELLNKATHKPRATFTDAQLQAMLARADGFLSFVLRISELGK